MPTDPSPALPQEVLLRAQRQKWRSVLEAANAAGTTAATEPANPEGFYKIRSHELEQEMEAIKSELARRQDKIERMQRSFSWKATAPLRSLRRLFDPAPASPPKASDSSAVTEPTKPASLWTIDFPPDWRQAPPSGRLRGWFLWLPSLAPALEIRARLNGTLIAARVGVERPDVTAALSLDATKSQRCGFSLEYWHEQNGQLRVELEALSPDGRWVVFHDEILHTGGADMFQPGYEGWLERHYGKNSSHSKRLRERLASCQPDCLPLIAVLMPVYNAPEKWLRLAIESVKRQTYTNWELCIADDASTEKHVRQVLEEAAAEDPRIRICFREQNGHISAASNSALELVTAPYVALLDHDDELDTEALAEVALHLADNPGRLFVYSDEDKIDQEGHRSNPYFKADFLPELLTGQNACSHLSVFSTEIIREVGGFRVGLEGSQDWDLALRVSERCSPSQIGHIPRVLYSWRMIPGSTAVAVDEKAYSVRASKRALLDHFARLGFPVQLTPVEGGHWRVYYPLPTNAPLVSIIIPTHDRADLLRTCVASLLSKTEYGNYELLIVDNRSSEPEAMALLDELREEPRVRVFRDDRPFNYSALNNLAVAEARGEFVLLLNNDIEITDGSWLGEMISHAVRPGIGAVGAMLLYPDDSIQHAGVILGIHGVAAHAFTGKPQQTSDYFNRARLAQNYSAVTGACLLLRKSIFEQVGGLNEKDLPVAFNDVDLCLKIQQAGFRNIWTPFAVLRHHESATRGNEDTPEKQARSHAEIEYMRRTWGPILDRDPAYNPNLALNEPWQLADSPRI